MNSKKKTAIIHLPCPTDWTGEEAPSIDLLRADKAQFAQMTREQLVWCLGTNMSRIYRFGGASPLSVAGHVLLGMRLWETLESFDLMGEESLDYKKSVEIYFGLHDVVEALAGDQRTPLKWHLKVMDQRFSLMETAWLVEVFEALGVLGDYFTEKNHGGGIVSEAHLIDQVAARLEVEAFDLRIPLCDRWSNLPADQRAELVTYARELADLPAAAVRDLWVEWALAEVVVLIE